MKADQSKDTVLQQKIRDLPPDLQQEVIDFIEFLVPKKVVKGRRHYPYPGWKD